MRFIPSAMTGAGSQIHDNSNAVLSTQQASVGRQKDKETKLLTKGNHEEDVIRVEELIDMGNMHTC